jgi:hypothetical protein
MSLTQERLKELLHYHPALGIFTWLVRAGSRASVGKIAGSLDNKGYVRINLSGIRYRAHRLAWLYMTGEWPTDQIDHINGVRNDNYWDNLREATNSTNMQNQRRAMRHNKTGFLGVTPYRRHFKAKIKLNGKTRVLGTFDRPELAYAAYLKAKRELHPGCTI